MCVDLIKCYLLRNSEYFFSESCVVVFCVMCGFLRWRHIDDMLQLFYIYMQSF